MLHITTRVQLKVVSNVLCKCSRKKHEKSLWIVKNKTANVIFEGTSFIVCALSNSGKEKAENTF